MVMKRTTPQKNTKAAAVQDNAGLSAYALLTRTVMSQYLGMQYGGDRNLYEALGYPTDITFDQYFQQYSRQDIAGAVINRPVEMTWKGVFSVYNPKDSADVLNDAWEQLSKALRLKDKFIRVDKLSSLGRFGILLLGFSDIKNANEDFEKPVGQTLATLKKSTAIKVNAAVTLKYVVPYAEDSVTISTWVTDAKSDRYGMPLLYDVTQLGEDGKTSATLRVHYSRVIHITGEKLDSEVYGVPVLQRVFNRLMDIEKLVGGSAEMFWRGARPGYTGKVSPEYTAPDDLKDILDTQMQEFEHNMRRILINQGVDITALQQQISDPMGHLDVQMQMISAYTGIPKRILMGSELGELASTQDRNSWVSYVTARREEYAETQIVREFVDRMMLYGVLPLQEYTVEWPDLYSVSDKEKADVGKVRADALRTYASEPMAASILPENSFLRFVMGFSDAQIAEIEQDVEDTAMIQDLPEEGLNEPINELNEDNKTSATE